MEPASSEGFGGLLDGGGDDVWRGTVSQNCNRNNRKHDGEKGRRQTEREIIAFGDHCSCRKMNYKI